LDNPVWTALAGPHAWLAERLGQAVRYPADVAPFFAIPERPGPDAWADLDTLAGPEAVVVVVGGTSTPPGWDAIEEVAGVQLVDAGVAAAPAPRRYG
jgi:hypothetical protein